MFHAFDAKSPGSVVNLAMSILKAEEKDHNLAVEMATAIREATLAMTVAMSLVTYCQNPENPIVAITKEEAEGEDCVGHTPGELLEALAEGFPGILEEWEVLVKLFEDTWGKYVMEREVAKIPKDFTVEDILGEKKES